MYWLQDKYLYLSLAPFTFYLWSRIKINCLPVYIQNDLSSYIVKWLSRNFRTIWVHSRFIIELREALYLECCVLYCRALLSYWPLSFFPLNCLFFFPLNCLFFFDWRCWFFCRWTVYYKKKIRIHTKKTLNTLSNIILLRQHCEYKKYEVLNVDFFFSYSLIAKSAIKKNCKLRTQEYYVNKFQYKEQTVLVFFFINRNIVHRPICILASVQQINIKTYICSEKSTNHTNLSSLTFGERDI